ncbi:MAG: hypothetical protein DMF63_06190 [Acidobacteria bacterium]|nr:MAG: hypothetical protein DMF63_06190 [Acidobacteriota bacterium]
MTKESLIWLVIRVVGFVSAFFAIASAITFISGLITVAQATGTVANATFGSFFGQFLFVVFYGVAASYLLRDGRFVFDVLNQEETPDKARRDLEDTSLHLDES